MEQQMNDYVMDIGRPGPSDDHGKKRQMPVSSQQREALIVPKAEQTTSVRSREPKFSYVYVHLLRGFQKVYKEPYTPHPVVAVQVDSF